MALPTTMKALIQKHEGFEATGLPSPTLENIADVLELSDVPLPVLKSGQVLIKVRMASVNPSDIMFVQGYYGQPRVLGAPAGFEGVGDVMAAKGIYASLLKGKRVSFVSGQNGSGAWAEYALADAATVIKLRDDVRDEDGAAMIVNPLTASAMVDLVPKGGAFIATGGASQLGKLMAGLARETGRRLISVARRDAPLAHLRGLGATHALNEQSESFADDLKAAIKAERPTVLLDAVAGAVSSRIFEEMGKDSRWIMYGKLTPEAPEIRQPGRLLFLRQKIEGFWLVTWMMKTPLRRKLTTIKAVQARFASGKWHTEVSETLGLKDVLQYLPKALAKPDGKVMIRPA